MNGITTIVAAIKMSTITKLAVALKMLEKLCKGEYSGWDILQGVLIILLIVAILSAIVLFLVGLDSKTIKERILYFFASFACIAAIILGFNVKYYCQLERIKSLDPELISVDEYVNLYEMAQRKKEGSELKRIITEKLDLVPDGIKNLAGSRIHPRFYQSKTNCKPEDYLQLSNKTLEYIPKQHRSALIPELLRNKSSLEYIPKQHRSALIPELLRNKSSWEYIPLSSLNYTDELLKTSANERIKSIRLSAKDTIASNEPNLFRQNNRQSIGQSPYCQRPFVELLMIDDKRKAGELEDTNNLTVNTIDELLDLLEKSHKKPALESVPDSTGTNKNPFEEEGLGR